ncbi:MAG: sulfate ABC transporter permease subunit CysT [Pirellulales bacterium]
MFARKRYSVIPGFGLSLGYTTFFLGLVVLLPLSMLFVRAGSMSWDGFRAAVTSPQALASYRLTFGTALGGAVINSVFGFLVAWVLTRYTFPGRRLLDACIDLPFALPTAVSGIALAAVYSKKGWLGRFFFENGIPTANSWLGVLIAMTFIGLPFVVRTLQPVLEELDAETEEAASSLGANRIQTFLKVIFPAVLPALITGFALAFARGLGEYGSVIFISGNRYMETEITSKLIFDKLENYDYDGATAIALTMLVSSFVILFAINAVQWWAGRKYRGVA